MLTEAFTHVYDQHIESNRARRDLMGSPTDIYILTSGTKTTDSWSLLLRQWFSTGGIFDLQGKLAKVFTVITRKKVLSTSRRRKLGVLLHTQKA